MLQPEGQRIFCRVLATSNLQKPSPNFINPEETPLLIVRYMLVTSLMITETDQLLRDQQARRQSSRHAVIARQNAAKGQHRNVPLPAPAIGLSVEAFLVLACVAVSLIVLPLVLPPLPPPPPFLLLVPVCLLLLLAALATFVPSDMKNMASSYL